MVDGDEVRCVADSPQREGIDRADGVRQSQVRQHAAARAAVVLGPRRRRAVHLDGSYVEPVGRTGHGDDARAPAGRFTGAGDVGGGVQAEPVLRETGRFRALAAVAFDFARQPIGGEGLAVRDRSLDDGQHLHVLAAGDEAENALGFLGGLRLPAPLEGTPAGPQLSRLRLRRIRKAGECHQQGEAANPSCGCLFRTHGISPRFVHRSVSVHRSHNLKLIPPLICSPVRSRSAKPRKM